MDAETKWKWREAQDPLIEATLFKIENVLKKLILIIDLNYYSINGRGFKNQI